jgi:hypothetical protein
MRNSELVLIQGFVQQRERRRGEFAPGFYAAPQRPNRNKRLTHLPEPLETMTMSYGKNLNMAKRARKFLDIPGDNASTIDSLSWAPVSITAPQLHIEVSQSAQLSARTAKRPSGQAGTSKAKQSKAIQSKTEQSSVSNVVGGSACVRSMNGKRVASEGGARPWPSAHG